MYVQNEVVRASVYFVIIMFVRVFLNDLIKMDSTS